jgi:hypothetical protein
LGKNKAISRFADSGESEPCTMLFCTSSAWSARMLPVVALSGSVAPASWRNASIARGPSTTAATSGPEVMKSTSGAKNGFSRCSA